MVVAHEEGFGLGSRVRARRRSKSQDRWRHSGYDVQVFMAYENVLAALLAVRWDRFTPAEAHSL